MHRKTRNAHGQRSSPRARNPLSFPANLLTLREAAARLKTSERTIRRRVDDGSIPAVRLGASPSSPLRIPEDELERWVSGSPEEAA